MFWIGLMVGFIVFALAPAAYILWCMHGLGVSFKEFGAVAKSNAYAFGNRESTVQVWHDGELLDIVTLEEK